MKIDDLKQYAPFSPNLVSYLDRADTCWFNVLEGAVRSGKNIAHAWKFCQLLEKHPDRMHLIGGYSISNAGALIYKSNGLGMERYYHGRIRAGKFEDKPCYYVHTATGEKIIMRAGGSNVRGQDAIAGYTFGMAYLTEPNRCDLEFVKEVFKRTFSSQNRKVFHDINPKSESHPYNTEILAHHEEMQAKDPSYGYNYGHVTMADNLSMTDDQIKKVIMSVPRGTVFFDRDILGLRRNTQGLVYSLFDRAKHIVPTVPRDYQEFWISFDYGVVHPRSFLLFGRIGQVWYLVDESYHDGAADGEKTIEENYAALKALAARRYIHRLVLDNAPIATSFNVHIKRKGEFHTRKANDAVLPGIQETTLALTSGKLKINDCCKHVIRESGLYMWDSKSNKDEPIKKNDDSWSAIRYFVSTARITRVSRR